jgi:hypothetical protein
MLTGTEETAQNSPGGTSSAETPSGYPAGGDDFRSRIIAVILALDEAPSIARVVDAPSVRGW